MKMKQIALLISAITAAGAASAAPFIPPGGPLYIQYNNLEQVSVSNTASGTGYSGEGNWGVFNISSIQAGAVSIDHVDIAGGPGVFLDDGLGGSQGQISGIFYGIKNTVVGGPSPLVLSGTGGFMDFYWNDVGFDDITATDLAGGFSPTNRNGITAGKFTDGTFLGRLAFKPGVVTNTLTTSMLGTFIAGTISGSGFTDAYLDVVDFDGNGVIDDLDGVWAPLLNTNWFYTELDGGASDPGSDNDPTSATYERRDVRLGTFTNGLPSWNGSGDTIGLRSNDPARTYAIPEPGSLALMGLGLIGAGLASRRRK